MSSWVLDFLIILRRRRALKYLIDPEIRAVQGMHVVAACTSFYPGLSFCLSVFLSPATIGHLSSPSARLVHLLTKVRAQDVAPSYCIRGGGEFGWRSAFGVCLDAWFYLSPDIENYFYYYSKKKKNKKKSCGGYEQSPTNKKQCCRHHFSTFAMAWQATWDSFPTLA